MNENPPGLYEMWAERVRPRLRRTLRAHEAGVTLILLAILLPTLILFVGFIMDTTLLYSAKDRVRTATDAAALAAAQECELVDRGKSAMSEVEREANELALANGVTTGGLIYGGCHGRRLGHVSVRYTVEVPLFMGALGAESPRPVSAEAEARFGPEGVRLTE